MLARQDGFMALIDKPDRARQPARAIARTSRSTTRKRSSTALRTTRSSRRCSRTLKRAGHCLRPVVPELFDQNIYDRGRGRDAEVQRPPSRASGSSRPTSCRHPLADLCLRWALPRARLPGLPCPHPNPLRCGETTPFEFTVPSSAAGTRLDLVPVAQSLPFHSQLARRIDEGEVLRWAPSQARPQAAGVVSVSSSPPPPSPTGLLPEAIPLDILYEDGTSSCCTSRPVSVHPAPRHPSGTLVNALHHCGALPAAPTYAGAVGSG